MIVRNLVIFNRNKKGYQLKFMIIIYFIKLVARDHVFISNTIRIIRLYAEFILYNDENRLKPKNHKS